MPDMPQETGNTGLRLALTRAAAYGVNTKRKIPLGGAPDSLRFVVDQIAGTILARRLVFSVGGDCEIECDVAGGRLLRFAIVIHPGTIPTSGDLTDLDSAERSLREFSDLLRNSIGDVASVSV